MALRAAMQRSGSPSFLIGARRWSHAIARPPRLDALIAPPPVSSPSVILPELDHIPDRSHPGFPSFSSGGSMELMAAPKRKVSPHRKGIRNGPKALKPVPVIIRCKSCGRVKLPHFYCCSGDRGKTNEQNGPN
ncbi:uncharacterized protein LOC116213452 [Punica granatum]|uniref:Large ribosomal subunit protein bL32m n=2 Tax=Punica granatum TaxID=22663 RepID=A0A218VUR8_PUNGR|nr:uncharacterized protein LOC116213452 [Punica granatum]OWM63820.1 hypothetical protein CDL15_Pgr006082 [Punica granatum]PKI66292.1 hypothetical protein CRG98_013318 [Punica granatum]